MYSIGTIITGAQKENCYVISDSNYYSVIIDPGDDSENIIEYISNDNFKPLAIINTHAHFDHTGAIAVIKKYYNIPFYLHSGDKRLLEYTNFYRKLIFKGKTVEIPKIDFFIDNKRYLEIGDFKFEVFNTPGHTKGGICLLINNYLFTGDILFKGNIGNTKFPESNKEDLKKSLIMISKLDINTKILPGHGEQTTLLNEISSNSKFKELIKEDEHST